MVGAKGAIVEDPCGCEFGSTAGSQVFLATAGTTAGIFLAALLTTVGIFLAVAGGRGERMELSWKRSRLSTIASTFFVASLPVEMNKKNHSNYYHLTIFKSLPMFPYLFFNLREKTTVFLDSTDLLQRKAQGDDSLFFWLEGSFEEEEE